MLYSAVAQVGFVALVIVTTFVLWSGERWARLSAVLHAVNWVAVSLLQVRHDHSFPLGDCIADVIGVLLAVLIAVLSRRVWAGSVAAFQMLGVCNYLIILFDHRVMHHAFWTVAYVWEGGALLSLVWGGIEGRASRRAAVRRQAPFPPRAGEGFMRG